jgi:hypothetical protein
VLHRDPFLLLSLFLSSSWNSSPQDVQLCIWSTEGELIIAVPHVAVIKLSEVQRGVRAATKFNGVP